jgi:hypothetical protein
MLVLRGGTEVLPAAEEKIVTIIINGTIRAQIVPMMISNTPNAISPALRSLNSELLAACLSSVMLWSS